MFLKTCSPLRYGHVEEHLKLWKEDMEKERRIVQEMKDPNYTIPDVIADDHMQPILPDFDAEISFKAIKYARSVFEDTNPREKRRVLSKNYDEECEKLGILAEAHGDVVYIGITGTHALLDLGWDLFTKAIPDWW